MMNDTEKNQFEPVILGFTCNWCSYRAADGAGLARAKYPPNIRLIRLMCSGRMDPQFILKGLADGADGVLVTGCHPGDCHYKQGNYIAQRRYSVMHRLLEFIGIESDRLYVEWVSASEGKRFADVVQAFTDKVKALGPLTLNGNKETLQQKMQEVAP